MKPLPQAPRAERAVLGCIMRQPGVLSQVVEVLKPTDFHRPEFAAIFELMIHLARENRDYGCIGLPEAVDARADRERFGTIGEILNLDANVPSVLALSGWVLEVRRASVRRELRDLLEKSLEQVDHDHGEVEGLLRQVVQVAGGLQGIAQDVDIHDAIDATLIEMQQECEPGSSVVMPTGLDELDELIGGGFRRKQMTVVGGRPGSGKTAFALNVARHLVSDGFVVGIASLEMTRTGLMRRLLSDVSQIPMDMITQPKLMVQEDWDLLSRVQGDMQDSPLFIVDQRGMTAGQIVAQARAWKLRGLDILIIDHFEEIQFRRMFRGENSAQPAADALTVLWEACDKLDIHLMLLSQLSRDVEKRADKRPMPADIRATDTIVQRAHNIIMIYRDVVYDKEAPSGGREGMEAIVRKQRNGRDGTAYLRFIGCTQSVRDVPVLGEVPHAAK